MPGQRRRIVLLKADQPAVKRSTHGGPQCSGTRHDERHRTARSHAKHLRVPAFSVSMPDGVTQGDRKDISLGMTQAPNQASPFRLEIKRLWGPAKPYGWAIYVEGRDT